MTLFVGAARARFQHLIYAGGVPTELIRDAFMMLTDQPPPWRPLRRRRWNRSAKRILDWAGVKTRYSWLNFMWTVLP